jgi:hypothetical protein
MRRLATLLVLSLATSARADPFCDVLMGYVHDAPRNQVATDVIPDNAGPQTVARKALAGARCLVSPYNPIGISDHVKEQSVYCFWSASEDKYPALLAEVNAHVAQCMGQDTSSNNFATRLEYNSNYGVVRVAADQMTNDWAISVTIMPLN